MIAAANRDGRGLDVGVIHIGDGECAIDNGSAIPFGVSKRGACIRDYWSIVLIDNGEGKG